LAQHIHPIFDQIADKASKEKIAGQTGFSVWMTGLSGSGKSTIARYLERKLHQKSVLVKLLDGDNLRTGLCKDLGFSEEDRWENIRRVAEVNKLFNDVGLLTVNSFVSPTLSLRQMARDIIGADSFYEVYVNAPLEVCEQRDVKGLYQKARAGEIKDFTGIHQAFEAPEAPALELRTDLLNVEECVESLYQQLSLKLQPAS
jgi:adenylylsulfate kinase